MSKFFVALLIMLPT